MLIKNLGIIGGGQLGSLLAVAAKKLNISTTIYCDDIDAPAQNFCNKFIYGKYDDKLKMQEFVNEIDLITYEFENFEKKNDEFIFLFLVKMQCFTGLKTTSIIL